MMSRIDLQNGVDIFNWLVCEQSGSSLGLLEIGLFPEFLFINVQELPHTSD